MPNQRCRACKQPVGQMHKSACARYYGMVLGTQDLEPDDTPEQRFEGRLTDDDRRLLSGMKIGLGETK